MCFEFFDQHFWGYNLALVGVTIEKGPHWVKQLYFEVSNIV